jgi:hypothetical protein
MANKYIKKSSPPTAIKEVQIKTTLRFYLSLARMAIMKKTTNVGQDAGVGWKDPLYTIAGNVNLPSQYVNQYGSSSKNEK